MKYPQEKTEYTPVFTGIPPHVLPMTELENIKLKMEYQTLEIIGKCKEELDA